MGERLLAGMAVGAAGLIVALGACASDERDGFTGGDGGGEEGGIFPVDGSFGDAIIPGLPEGETRDPETCEEAKTTKSYVGCDYWPTITANPVWSIFDFAVVVANTGTANADVTVTGPSATNRQVTVPAGQIRKIYLPWVTSLKGPDADECLVPTSITSSVVAASGAFHLVSTSPVIVYQFNVIEYKGQGGEGSSGGPKDWSSCPGSTTDCNALQPPKKIGCFSFSNDASLLLPSTAMTGNYRVAGLHGFTAHPPSASPVPLYGSTLSITSTQAATEVTVTLGPAATVRASAGGPVAIAATSGGNKLTFTLPNAGDVAQLVTELGEQYDFSGSLVQADKPIQVIASVPAIYLPKDKAYADHVEESVPPAETLGKRYVVHPPTGPKGTPVAHVVRLFGNKDGTSLTYVPARPPQCPTSLAAGQIADCGIVDTAFEVSATNEFAVATFLLGSSYYDPTAADLRGDPSQTSYASIEQFRTKYVFLAPDDFSASYVDITAPANAGIEVDGVPLADTPTAIAGTAFSVHRVKLGVGQAGAHTLSSKLPVGVQVVGYGDNSSYQVPGGLNLKLIAPPPPPPK